MLNKFLAQEVKKHLGDTAVLPEAFVDFIKSVSGSYDWFADRIESLENSVADCANELLQSHEKLVNETAGLKNAHNELSRIFNQVNEGFFAKDIIADRYIQMSVGCEKIYGYSIDDFYNNSLLWFQVIHPDDRYLIDNENELLNKGIQIISTYRIIHKDKTTRWVEVKAVPVMVEGRLFKVEGVVNDITERKNAEQEIKKSEKFLKDSLEKNRLIMSAALDAIIWIDPTDKITFWNPRAEKIFGWKQEDVKGSLLSDLIIPLPFREMHRRGMQKYLQTGQGPALNVLLELSAINREGHEFPIELTILPIMQGDEKFFCAFIRDITQRKKAETQIKDSEHRYRNIFEQNLAGIYQTTTSGRILSCNHAFSRMLGYASPQELMQINVDDLYYGNNDRENFISILREQKKLHNYEGVLKCRNGNPLHIIENISLSVDPVTGEEICDGILIDITERRIAEKNIQESIERFQRLSQATHDAIWEWDLQTDEVWWNEGFFKLFGYDKELPIPALYEWTKKIHPDDQFKVTNRLRQIRKNTVDYWEDEFRYEMGENNYGTVLDRAYVLRDHSGKPIRTIGAIMDISERKKTEQQIAASEQRYRQIVETAQEGIWMIDENNHTTFINNKMSELIEYLPEEIMGKSIHSYMDEEANKNAPAQIERRKAGISETHDATFITKSGKAVSTSLSANGIFDANGVYKGALAMITDITKRKLDQELLQQSEANLDLKNKELERKNKELEQFAYVASHDLQEPLRTTSGFAQLLKEQYKNRLDDKADKYLNFIVDSSDRMKILISDLLDYSRIGNKFELESVDCNKVLQDVIADLNKAIIESKAEIISEDLPVIKGYPTLIKQLFQNLIINAIKFSKKDIDPKVKISAKRMDGYWNFAIADNGIGIDKVHSERIFIIFQRLHNRSEYPGSGIGLSHCKKIVELHNGKIWLESTLGIGSTFHFTIQR